MDEDDDVDALSTLLCRPADMSVLGRGLPTLAPLDDGWVVKTCETCGMDVHMGVRQKAAYDTYPGKFSIICFKCLPKMTKRMGEGPEILHVQHLGGP